MSLAVPVSVIDAADAVVNACRVNGLSTHLETVDRIVLDLESCSQNLCDSIATVAQTSVEYELLRELNQCISYLLVEWELKLVSLEPRRNSTSSGRPRKRVNIELVEFLREMRLTWEQCAGILMISRTTLWRRCREIGISLNATTCISNSDLDAVMQRLSRQHPRCGAIMTRGYLRSYGIYVLRRRVRESLLRVSPGMVQSHATTTVARRRYTVTSSNALWHIDGLHCLVRWRIVVHGGIDGYSRQIVFLRASDNNRAETVLRYFTCATRKYGWPSQVRSDHGGENIDVARAMIMCRGTGRSSHISGASVHNQRIERLWRDTFRCVCHSYYSLFYEMEACDLLNPVRDKHLFCLRYVYLPRINMQLSRFIEGWNNHPLRTERGLTPSQLWIRGLCIASPSVIEQPEEYGIDSGDYINPFNVESVTVPETDVGLSRLQLDYLHQHHNPLAHSEYEGVDVYMAVLNTVSAMVP